MPGPMATHAHGALVGDGEEKWCRKCRRSIGKDTFNIAHLIQHAPVSQKMHRTDVECGVNNHCRHHCINNKTKRVVIYCTRCTEKWQMDSVTEMNCEDCVEHVNRATSVGTKIFIYCEFCPSVHVIETRSSLIEDDENEKEEDGDEQSHTENKIRKKNRERNHKGKNRKRHHRHHRQSRFDEAFPERYDDDINK